MVRENRASQLDIVGYGNADANGDRAYRRGQIFANQIASRLRDWLYGKRLKKKLL